MFRKTAQKAVELEASIHMPRIGCGFAGGSWKTIEDIILKTIISKILKFMYTTYRRKGELWKYPC